MRNLFFITCSFLFFLWNFLWEWKEGKLCLVWLGYIILDTRTGVCHGHWGHQAHAVSQLGCNIWMCHWKSRLQFGDGWGQSLKERGETLRTSQSFENHNEETVTIVKVLWENSFYFWCCRWFQTSKIRNSSTQIAITAWDKEESRTYRSDRKPREANWSRDTPVFVAALFTRAKTWTQLNVHQQINR